MSRQLEEGIAYVHRTRQGHKSAAKAETRPKPFVAGLLVKKKKGRNSDTHSVRTLTKSLLLRLAWV